MFYFISASSESEDECWEDNEEILDHDYDVPLIPSATPDTEESTLLTWLILFIIHLQAKFYLPDTALIAY